MQDQSSANLADDIRRKLDEKQLRPDSIEKQIEKLIKLRDQICGDIEELASK